jgi:hypothetical protein
MKCEQCKWATEFRERYGDYNGPKAECHRRPPGEVSITAEEHVSSNENNGRGHREVRTNLATSWPRVALYDWCGEFEAKP